MTIIQVMTDKYNQSHHHLQIIIYNQIRIIKQMLLPPDETTPPRKFKHPLIATMIGIFIGLFLIGLAASAIYTSSNHLSDCKKPQIYPLYFLNGTVDNSTTVSICKTDNYVQLKWEIKDNYIVSTYENCHDPIYLEDSVGVMLKTPLHKHINSYYTIIVNPKGVVYSQQTSPYNEVHSHPFDCGEIKSQIYQHERGWQTNIKIPINKIGNGYITATEVVNFFRINIIDSSGRKVISINDKYHIDDVQKYISATTTAE